MCYLLMMTKEKEGEESGISKRVWLTVCRIPDSYFVSYFLADGILGVVFWLVISYYCYN